MNRKKDPEERKDGQRKEFVASNIEVFENENRPEFIKKVKRFTNLKDQRECDQETEELVDQSRNNGPAFHWGTQKFETYTSSHHERSATTTNPESWLTID